MIISHVYCIIFYILVQILHQFCNLQLLVRGWLVEFNVLLVTNFQFITNNNKQVTADSVILQLHVSHKVAFWHGLTSKNCCSRSSWVAEKALLSTEEISNSHNLRNPFLEIKKKFWAWKHIPIINRQLLYYWMSPNRYQWQRMSSVCCQVQYHAKDCSVQPVHCNQRKLLTWTKYCQHAHAHGKQDERW